MKNHALGVLLLLVALGLPAPANAALIPLGSEMIWDSDFNITWVRNLKYFDTWPAADSWAKNLVFEGYDDWRLPSAMNRDGSGPCTGECRETEWGHLYYVELGNSINAGETKKTGLFTNLGDMYYWTGTPGPAQEYPNAYALYFPTGGLFYANGWIPISAVAVRDGGMPIPEPTSLLLLGAGLIGLRASRRPRG